MNEYGDFRIVEPIHSDGLVTTYHASKLGADGSKLFVLRVYRPPDAIMGSPRAAMDMVRFLDSGISHREAAKDARHVVSVHDLGQAHGDAYIVTDGFRTTLQSLIDYRIQLSADVLRLLVIKVIRGLIEYQSKASRPHDNLNATTVMLNSMQDPTSAQVALAEPGLPTAESVTDLCVDAAALGRLIHALVEFRPAWAPIRWPVPPSDAWKRLGRSGERWRELTNRLLDPNAAEKGDDLDLEDILRSLPIEPPDYRKPIRLSVAAIVVAALGGYLYWQFIYDPLIKKEQLNPLRANIAFNCQEHLDWLYKFRASVSDNDPLAAFREVTALDDDVAILAENVLGKIKEAEDNKYFDSKNYFPEISPNMNWAGVNQSIQGDNVDLTLFTVSQFDEIKEVNRLIRELRENFRIWKTDRFLEHVEAFDDRKWHEASKSLQREIGDDDAPPSVEQLQNLLTSRLHLTAIDSLWEPIENVSNEAPGEGKDVLDHFQPTMQDLMASLISVEAIHNELDKNVDLVARMSEIATDEGAQIEWDLFEDNISPPAENTVEAFETWSLEADQYRRLPPETRIDDQQYQTDLEMLQVNINDMEEFGATEEAEGFVTKRYEVEAAYQMIHDLDRIKKNELKLDSAVIAVLELETHAKDCEVLRNLVVKEPGDYIAEQRLLTFDSSSLQSSWGTAIDSVGTVAELETDRDKYRAAFKRLRGVNAILLHLDETALSIQSEDLPARSAGWTPDVALDILSQKREAAIGRVAFKVVASESPPTLETDAISQSLATEETTFGEWYGQAQRMFTYYLKIERMFDEGHHPDEQDQASGDSVLSIVSEWETEQSEPGALLGEFRPALTGIIDRIDLNRNMMTMDNPREVMSIVEDRDPSVRPELYRTAWKRLGELTDANHATAIHQDHQLLVALTGWLESFDGNPERQQFVKDSLESEAHDRWVSRMQKHPSPADDKDEALEGYEGALLLHEPFHVRSNDLAPWMQWNLKLLEFRFSMTELDEKDEHEIEAREAVKNLQIELNAYGPPLTNLDAIGTMTEELNQIANDEKKTVDFNDIGPAGTELRWAYDKDAEVRNEARPNRPPLEIMYRKTQGRSFQGEIRFKLLDPDEHVELRNPVYISTEEVSFKVFKHVAESPEHVKYVENFIELGIGNNDGRKGPRVWEQAEGAQGGIALKTPGQWLVNDSRRPAEFPMGQAPRLQPSFEHPVQHISVAVAIYVANALGCRLPTTEEFKAAIVEQYGDLDFSGLLTKINGNNFQGHIPNLRDTTFTSQLVFAVAEELENDLRPFSPEIGAFHPDSDPDHTYRFDDNDLWFDITRAEPGNGFQHLYGNVQEWVYDDPDSVTPDEDEPIMPPGEIVGNIKIEHLGVIGGSALSSSVFTPHTRQNVEDPELLSDLLMLTYSDVGFRLVITGKFDTVAQQVLAATSRGYVNLN